MKNTANAWKTQLRSHKHNSGLQNTTKVSKAQITSEKHN